MVRFAASRHDCGASAMRFKANRLISKLPQLGQEKSVIAPWSINSADALPLHSGQVACMGESLNVVVKGGSSLPTCATPRWKGVSHG
jgi:hypothetical protein